MMSLKFLQSKRSISKRPGKEPVWRTGWPFPLEIQWSSRRRKTIAIEVLPQGVRLCAPSSLSIRQIENALKRHTDELFERWQTIARQSPVSWSNESAHAMENSVRLFGEPLTIELTRANRKRVRVTLEGQTGLCVRYPEELEGHQDKLQKATHDAVVSWLKGTAKDDFADRLERWSKDMGLRFNQLRLKDQKTRWGSCSTLGNINLNWRLIQAPEWIIDYVVVHELAHLREMNHSPQFWAIVREYCPNYLGAKKWLRENGRLLHQL